MLHNVFDLYIFVFKIIIDVSVFLEYIYYSWISLQEYKMIEGVDFNLVLFHVQCYKKYLGRKGNSLIR